MKGRVRIIGGQWKRRWLTVIDLPGLRPTADRVRETLFNWLGQELHGQSCLDMFSGSGVLGFEAASRGAASVLMLERSLKAVQQLQSHHTELAAQQVKIVMADAISYAATLPEHSFDLIFIDPPFAQPLLVPALQIAYRLLKINGLVYAEHAQPISFNDWSVVHHGQTRQTHYYLLQPKAK